MESVDVEERCEIKKGHGKMGCRWFLLSWFPFKKWGCRNNPFLSQTKTRLCFKLLYSTEYENADEVLPGLRPHPH